MSWTNSKRPATCTTSNHSKRKPQHPTPGGSSPTDRFHHLPTDRWWAALIRRRLTRRRSARPPHHDKPGPFQVRHKPVGDDPRHRCISLVHAFPSVVAKRKRQGVDNVGGTEFGGRIGHGCRVARGGERIKNKLFQPCSAATSQGPPISHMIRVSRQPRKMARSVCRLCAGIFH